MRAVQCICQEHRLPSRTRPDLAGEGRRSTAGALLLELVHQIGEHLDERAIRFPLLLTREELASMASTPETVRRTLG
jgi:hypothetical protein